LRGIQRQKHRAILPKKNFFNLLHIQKEGQEMRKILCCSFVAFKKQLFAMKSLSREKQQRSTTKNINEEGKLSCNVGALINIISFNQFKDRINIINRFYC